MNVSLPGYTAQVGIAQIAKIISRMKKKGGMQFLQLWREIQVLSDQGLLLFQRYSQVLSNRVGYPKDAPVKNQDALRNIVTATNKELLAMKTVNVFPVRM